MDGLSKPKIPLLPQETGREIGPVSRAPGGALSSFQRAAPFPRSCSAATEDLSAQAFPTWVTSQEGEYVPLERGPTAGTWSCLARSNRGEDLTRGSGRTHLPWDRVGDGQFHSKNLRLFLFTEKISSVPVLWI